MWFYVLNSRSRITSKEVNILEFLFLSSVLFFILSFVILLPLYYKGKPIFIDSPSIVNPLTSKVFELGEVLQLQCSGDKNFSTQFTVMKILEILFYFTQKSMVIFGVNIL